MRWKYALAGLLTVGLLALGPATLAAGPTIDVTGTGSVDVVPDQATLSLGVTTRGQTAAAAVAADNVAMQALVTALQGTGIPARRIRTTNFYVSPVYTAQKDPSQVAEIAGFECGDTVRADLTDVSAVGHTIDVALAAGANRIQGVRFTVADISAPERQALALAVADARAKAEVIAAAAGLQLGPIQSIGDAVAATPDPAAYGPGGGGTPVSPGQQAVTVNVQMTFGAS